MLWGLYELLHKKQYIGLGPSDSETHCTLVTKANNETGHQDHYCSASEYYSGISVWVKWLYTVS